MGAASPAADVSAFGKLRWSNGESWRQRALTDISELRTFAGLMARLADRQSREAEALANEAARHLDMAEEAIRAAREGGRTQASAVTVVNSNINAAACLVLWYAPLEEVQARLPDLVATVDEQLPAGDLRRINADDILRRVQKANGAKANGPTPSA